MVTNSIVQPRKRPETPPASHSSGINFKQLTKAELCKIAEDNGVSEATLAMRKADLIELLKGAGL